MVQKTSICFPTTTVVSQSPSIPISEHLMSLFQPPRAPHACGTDTDTHADTTLIHTK